MSSQIRNVKIRAICWSLFMTSCFSSICYGQLFPGIEGQELIDAIRDNYTPGQLLNDTQLRDTLYARVFRQDDSVKCIYSGFAKVLPEGVDPSQWLFGNGTETASMNLEHGWPQAKGAGDGTLGNRNMHHLYPSRTAINSDRANFPFQDIVDATTQKWYYLGMQQSTIPPTNINAYSEFKKGFFEPRESVKGDIARAMFYFWTIYHDDAVDADPFFFELQRSDLCAWHDQDPVDAFESQRSALIASYQEGKENPFVLDCSLAMRTYCGELPECEIVHVKPIMANRPEIWFDPLVKGLTVHADDDEMWDVVLYLITGSVVGDLQIRSNEVGFIPFLTSGMYIAIARNKKQTCAQIIFLP